jgi:hypothetical protein
MSLTLRHGLPALPLDTTHSPRTWVVDWWWLGPAGQVRGQHPDDRTTASCTDLPTERSALDDRGDDGHRRTEGEDEGHRTWP